MWWKQKVDRCSFPQNSTFLCPYKLFADLKYMPMNIPGCCQPSGMILIKNTNGRQAENTLIPIAFWAMVAAISWWRFRLSYLNILFCTFANHTKLVWTIVLRTGSYLNDIRFSSIQFIYHSKKKRSFSWFMVFYFQFPFSYQTRKTLFRNSQFSWDHRNLDSDIYIIVAIFALSYVHMSNLPLASPSLLPRTL